MTRLVRLGSVVAVVLLTWSCSGDSGSPGSASPTPVSPSRRVLLVTHTEGFRHSSLEIAEATITALGQRSGLFSTRLCRTASDVSRMLTRSALADVDAGVGEDLWTWPRLLHRARPSRRRLAEHVVSGAHSRRHPLGAADVEADLLLLRCVVRKCKRDQVITQWGPDLGAVPASGDDDVLPAIGAAVGHRRCARTRW